MNENRRGKKPVVSLIKHLAVCKAKQTSNTFFNLQFGH